MTDKPKNTDAPSELSGDDLDMAVGGASAKDVAVVKSEENIKLKVPAEERRKMTAKPREEKLKHQ
ncbi:MAG: hypothetical protein AAF479_04945 [Pseudomonadota bacterium]